MVAFAFAGGPDALPPPLEVLDHEGRHVAGRRGRLEIDTQRCADGVWVLVAAEDEDLRATACGDLEDGPLRLESLADHDLDALVLDVTPAEEGEPEVWSEELARLVPRGATVVGAQLATLRRLAARRSDLSVGVVNLGLLASRALGLDTLVIDHAMVHPGARRQGMRTVLWRHAALSGPNLPIPHQGADAHIVRRE